MMADSLLLAGISTLGFVPGTAQVLLAPDGDLDGPPPDTATIASLILDGDVQSGERYGNRQVTLPFVVFGTSRASLQTTIDAFLLAVSQKSWLMTWTPSGCAGTVFTCYRAKPTVEFDLKGGAANAAKVTLTFAMRPFGQSVSPVSVTVAATGGPAQLQVDGFNTTSMPTNSTRDTTTKYEGASSATFTLSATWGLWIGSGAARSRFGRFSSPTISKTVSLDLSAYTSMSVRFATLLVGVGCNVTLTLTDGTNTMPMTASVTASGGWDRLFFGFDASNPINLAAITGWTLTVLSEPVFDHGSTPSTTGGWIDDLRAYPVGSVGNATGEGSVLAVPSVLGSARTPVAVKLDRGGNPITNLLLHSPPNDADADLTILAGLAAGTVTVPAANMNYDSTYSVCVFFAASAAGSTSRTVTATFVQNRSGTAFAVKSITVTLIGTQTIAVLGNIELPIVAIPAENITSSMTITVTSADGTDVISDVALCDTQGQTILLEGLGSAQAIWVDPPNPLSGVGPIYASGNTSRVSANWVGDTAIVRTDPIQFEPSGVNRLLAASTDGAPNATFTYTPSWLHEALA